MKNLKRNRSISLRIPDTLHAKLTALAAQDKRTFSDYVMNVLVTHTTKKESANG